jgi:hypothetical protein
MTQTLKYNPDDTPFEAFKIWNQRKVRRCQARVKNEKNKGYQCPQNAVKGKDVCQSHGGGTKKRVLTGSRKPAGAQLKHGFYAKTLKQDIRKLYENGVIDKAYKTHEIDEEIAFSRLATEKMMGLEPDILLCRDLLEQIRTHESDKATILEASRLLAKFMDFYPLIYHLLKGTSKIVLTAVKIDNLTATSKARGLFVELLIALREILMDHVSYEVHMAIAEKLQARFGDFTHLHEKELESGHSQAR